MIRRIVIFAVLLTTAGAAVLFGGARFLDGDVDSTSSGSPALSAPGGSVGLPRLDVDPADSADGDLDDRTVSVDSDEPAVSRLDPALLGALRDAARAAEDDGVQVRVTSGWRSRDYQQRLLDEAIAKYGSREEALRWVATPDTSAHTTGDAVDVGPTAAADWMSRHGAEFGLCQTYANELWHYELRASPGGTCPAPLVDGNS